MIQGEGPRRSSLERHRSLGRIGAQKNYNLQRVNVIIFLPYIGQAKQGAKHTKNPHVQGARTQDSTT